MNETPLAYDFSSVTTMFFGWAPLAPGSLAALRRLCSPRFTAYALIGQTEALACHRFFIDRHMDVFLRHSPAVNYVGLPVPMLASTVMDMESFPETVGGKVLKYKLRAMLAGDRA